jgi:MFS transporter, DHA3 family, macrolide efflux protein
MMRMPGATGASRRREEPGHPSRSGQRQARESRETPSPLPPRGYRRFVILWTGQLLSSLGSGMTAFALGVYVFRLTGTVTGFAAVVLSLFVPSILLRPVGGILADRFDRRRMIIIGDAGAAMGVLFLMLVVAGSPPPLWVLYLGAGVSSACSALQNPAYKALVTDLLTPEEYSRAGGLVQLAASAQHLLSPLVAGLLMGLAPIVLVLAIDAATFGAAIVAVVATGSVIGGNRESLPGGSTNDTAATGGARAVAPESDAAEAPDGARPDQAGAHASPQPAADRPAPDRPGAGWRAIAGDPTVGSVVAIMAVVTFFVGFLQTLFAPMVLTITDAGTLGLIQSVSATGMVATSLVLGVVAIRHRHGAVLTTGLLAAGLSLVFLGAGTALPAITVSFFLFFAALPLINTSAEVMIRRRVPGDRQGRAWGLIGLVTQTGYIAAYAAAGPLADRVVEPMLMPGGVLAASVGRVIGVGPGRGMGLMILAAGVALTVIGLAAISLSTTARRRTVRHADSSRLPSTTLQEVHE